MNTPIENRTTPNLDQLSDARQQVVRNLLSPGETLRWVSQPDNSWWVKTPWIWGVCGVATVAGCVLSVLIYQHSQPGDFWEAGTAAVRHNAKQNAARAGGGTCDM